MYKEHMERQIYRGSLVLLINYKRPTKSGWWRVEYDKELDDVYLILEQPLHKDFNPYDEKLMMTHKEKDLFVMKVKNLRYSILHTQENKYEILAVVRGVDSVLLSKYNYDLSKVITEEKIENSSNIVCSYKFKDVKNIFYKKEQDTELISVIKKFK